MLTPMYKKKKIITILLILFFLIVLMSLTNRERDRLTIVEDIIISAVSPFQNAVFTASAQVRDFVELLQEYQYLAKENNRLTETLGNYKGISNEMEEIKQENKRLREMLDFKDRSDHTLMPAKVIARDPSNWFNTVIINKGHKDGVSKDMAIITNEGLVGNVLSVSRHASKVLLLTDSLRAVSGTVQESREMGTIGFVEGFVDEPGYCRMVNISQDAEINDGDVVVSSGLGGVFPPGLVIGEVIEVGQDEYGLLKYALIKPAVSFNRLEEVFVVKSAGDEFLSEKEIEHYEEEFSQEEEWEEHESEIPVEEEIEREEMENGYLEESIDNRRIE